MTLYVCLDDKNGMLFNRRRQSRDRMVLEDIANSITGVLTIDPFSESLIQQAGIPFVLTGEGPVPEDAHVFLEIPSEELVNRADSVVIYRWNRRYPGDVFWTWDLQAMGFTLQETAEFAGSSHETVTKEVYVR